MRKRLLRGFSKGTHRQYILLEILLFTIKAKEAGMKMGSASREPGEAKLVEIIGDWLAIRQKSNHAEGLA